jgi:hypothetical protein
VLDERRKGVLYLAGYTVGMSWGKDLEWLSYDLKGDAGDVDTKLELWTQYDNTGGLGCSILVSHMTATEGSV